MIGPSVLCDFELWWYIRAIQETLKLETTNRSKNMLHPNEKIVIIKFEVDEYGESIWNEGKSW